MPEALGYSTLARIDNGVLRLRMQEQVAGDVLAERGLTWVMGGTTFLFLIML